MRAFLYVVCLGLLMIGVLGFKNGGEEMLTLEEEVMDCMCDLEVEREALMVLYEATDGANWIDNTNWLTNVAVGEWYGVSTDGNGCVIGLDFDGDLSGGGSHPSGNNLIGNIPSTLGNLSNLIDLNFSGNRLSGSIPLELGNLNSLEGLLLHSNTLSGTIPPELGNLTNLENLYLFNNELSGSIPSELGNLSNLWELSLFNNELSGSIPPELENLSSLWELSLFNNELSGSIPSELGNLVNLRYLHLYNNSLSGSIPSELGNLSNLSHLNLSNNALNGAIPSELGDLFNLESLYLFNNTLSGDIPSELGNLMNLEWLYLNHNKLEGCWPTDLSIFCELSYNEDFDSFDVYNGDTIWYYHQSGYNLTNNPSLPWQGDFQRYCNGDPQIGAPCNDNNPNTDNDSINDNCECIGTTVEVFTCREQDSLALVALYESTDGANWTNPWNLTLPIDYWSGIYFNEEGCVKAIQLTNKELNGVIPTEIGELSYLENLSLGSNNLSGNIPVELGNLANLITLRIPHCDLSGSIPSSIGHLINLQQINLAANNLSGNLPSELGELINLENITLDWNFTISGTIPLELGQLSNLKTLNLHGNQLHGIIPLELTQLTNLVYLNLGNNELTGIIPPELSQLVNLQNLELRANYLTSSIPQMLGQLSSLRALNLSDNQLTGEIPVELGQLDSLLNLTLHSNQLSGTLPVELGQLSNLDWLQLSNNQLTGAIPSEFAQLSNLRYIRLDNNQLTGVIPEGLGILNRLNHIYFNDNELSGCFPQDLINLCNVNYDFTGNFNLSNEGNFDIFCIDQTGICLTNCGIGDSLILETLYQATNGGNWDDASNWLSDAPISDWYGITTNDNGCVIEIDLNGNGLSGSLPPDLGNLTNLTKLNLRANQIGGVIPPELGNLTDLVELNLRSNQLTGEIPMELGNLINLTELGLRLNQLSGDIPPELGNLTQLKQLYLNNNQLSGSLPTELGGLTNLLLLSVLNNQLTGNIPRELGNLEQLTHLFLNHNQFNGNIPPELGDLSNLEELYLHHNQLIGNLPIELENLSQLRRLYLSYNQLQGCFPDELFSFCSLSFNEDFDNITVVNGDTIGYYYQDGYNFSNNPALSWHGDFQEFCNGENQLGAFCDDGETSTLDDEITEDCDCRGAPCMLALNVISQPATCGLANGSAAVQLLEPFSYSIIWSTGETETLTLNQLSAGTYSVSITGEMGCLHEEQFIIEQDSDLPIAQIDTPINLTCAQTVIQLNASSSQNTDAFQWSSVGGNILTGNNSPNPSVNAAGIYTLVAQNTENGCTDTTSIAVIENILAPDLITAVPSVLTCADPSTLIQVHNTSPMGNYIYEWQHSGNTNLSTVVNEPGTYTLIAQNMENACTTTVNIEVTEDIVEPDINVLEPTLLTCTQSSVIIQAQNTDSNGQYTYSWWTLNGAIVSNANTLNPTVNAIGTYQLTAQNTNNGCSKIFTVMVEEDFNTPQVTLVENLVLTCTESSVLIEADIVSNNNNLTYHWSRDGQTLLNEISPSLDIEASGIYTIQVTNQDNGCIGTATLEVSDNQAAPIVQIATPDALTCTQTTTILDATASEWAEHLEAVWSLNTNPIAINDLSIEVSTAGTYQLTIYNTENGCETTTTVTVLDDTILPVADAGEQQELACNTASLLIGSNNSSMGENYNYHWSHNGQSIFNNNELLLEVDEVGWYILQIENTENGCIAIDSTEVVNGTDYPIAEPEPIQTLTCEEGILVLDAGTSSLGAEFSYSWAASQGGQILADEFSPNPSIGSAGLYELTILNVENNCLSTATVEVLLNTSNALDTAEVYVEDVSCYGENDGLIEVENILGGIPPYEYALQDMIFQESPIFEQQLPGLYHLVVRDNQNCEVQIDLHLTEPSALEVMIVHPVSNQVYLGDETTFDLAFQNVVGALSYQWTVLGESSISCINCESPSVFPLSPSTFIVEIMDEEGCIARDSIDLTPIELNHEDDIIITPNGDGLNDKLIIEGVELGGIYEENDGIVIFNRWGTKVYENPTYNNEWEGLNKNNKPLPQGTYYFVMRLSTGDGKTLFGNFLLIR